MFWYNIISSVGPNYYETGNYTFDIYDMYSIKCLRIISSVYDQYISGNSYMYRLESIYRYSGLLYDKLRILLSYIYRNNYREKFFRFTLLDYLSISTHRFNTNIMCPSYYSSSYIVKNITPELKRSYFIHA